MTGELTSALRALRASPGASLVSIATMGVGIGVTSVLFALVSGIVIQPLPYPAPDRLVRIFETNAQVGAARAGAASGNVADWRRRATAFDGLAGFYATGRTLSTEAGAEVLITAQVSRDFFDVFRVAPLIGRTFTDEEVSRATFNTAAAPIGPDPVVVLSHGLWQRAFGADPAIEGRVVTLERRAFRVVGVMPPGFAMPDPRVQLWIPWRLEGNLPRDQHYLQAVARLRAGTTIAQAKGELGAVASDLATEFPSTNRGWGVDLAPLQEATVGDAGGVLWMLLGAVGLVLVVACANVALLSLIRQLDRARETAVRAALGASGGRLLRESLAESGLLAAAGGVLGVGLAAAGLAALRASDLDLPRLQEVTWDARVLLFALAATTVSAVLAGLLPAWHRARTAADAGLWTSGTRTTARRHGAREGLVVLQTATAVVLLVGAALVTRSVTRLQAADPGFDPQGVLVAPVFLDSAAYSSGEHTRTYYRTLFDRLRAVPGVLAVGSSTTVPTAPLGPDFERPAWPEGVTSESARVPAWVRVVTSGYVEALRLRVADGRAIDDRDRTDAPRVAMISESLARRLWPGESAVGRQLVVDYSTAGTYPHEVVGVIGDVNFRGPRGGPLLEIYLAHAQRSYLIQNVVIRAEGDPRALMPAVRAVMREIDPQKPAHGLYPLTDLIASTYARDRQVMVALTVFGAAAMLLSALAVYGVTSQRVRERTREIGIRLAIGADRPRVVAWVAASSLRLVAVGVGVGLAAAWTFSGALEGLLFGVARSDGAAAGLALLALLAVGLVASLLPAWRAARIDPVEVLRRG